MHPDGPKSDDSAGARPSRFPDAPENIRRLPVDDRGFPIPHFVAVVNGKPDHRVVDPSKLEPTVQGNLCWICGEPLGQDSAFVMGPTSAFTRVTSEPASHWACGCFAASGCPFLTKPRMRRNHKGLESANLTAPANMLEHNPGLSVVWAASSFTKSLHADGRTWVFRLGQPTQVAWFREGRRASRKEVVAVIDGIVASYRTLAEEGGAAGAARLADYRERIMALVPDGSPP